MIFQRGAKIEREGHFSRKGSLSEQGGRESRESVTFLRECHFFQNGSFHEQGGRASPQKRSPTDCIKVCPSFHH